MREVDANEDLSLPTGWHVFGRSGISACLGSGVHSKPSMHVPQSPVRLKQGPHDSPSFFSIIESDTMLTLKSNQIKGLFWLYTYYLYNNFCEIFVRFNNLQFLNALLPPSCHIPETMFVAVAPNNTIIVNIFRFLPEDCMVRS